ncbi:MAG TPA: ankyrin repeat domain-containing protein [Candidatus Babeliales bacterium]|nr:ankyrin repeat domain-containing protein [Candidatus Babeliales bacterium]
MVIYLIVVIFFSVFSICTMDQGGASSTSGAAVAPRRVVALTPDQWKRIFPQMVEEANVRSVERLLNSIPEGLENYVAQNSWNLISFAINNNNPELLNLLIKAGARVNGQSLVYPNIPPNPEIIRILLAAGVAPKASDLLEAVRWGSTDVVAQLLQVGVDPNIRDQGLNISLLSEAIRRKNYQIALLLLNAGVQPERIDDSFVLDPFQMFNESINNFDLFKRLALFLNSQERRQALLLDLAPLQREFLERLFYEFPDPTTLNFLAFRRLALTRRGLEGIGETPGFSPGQRTLLGEFR